MAWINLGYQWNRMRGLPPDARIPHELLQVSTRRIGDRMEAAAARILTGDQINAIGAMSGSTLTPARRVADAFVNAQDLSQFGITPEQEAQLQQAFADMHSEAREAVATTIVRYARDNPEMLRGLGDANVQALMRELGGGRPAHGLPKPYTEGYTAALPGAALRREVDPATGALTSKFGPASLEAISRDPWGYRALMASSEGKWGPWQKEFTTRVQQEASQIADRLATGMLNEEQARIIKSHKTDPTRPPVNMHGEGYNSPEYAERLARAIRYAREGRDPTVQRWLQENALILEQNLPGTKSLAEATPQEIVAASVAAMNDRTIIVRPQPIELMMKSGSDPAEYAEHLADAIQDARAGRNRIMQEWLEENAPILERKIRADKPVPTPEASPQEIVAATVAAMFDRTIAEHPPELSLRHGEQYSSASYGLRLIDAIQDARAGRNPTMKRWLEANATILQQAIPGNKDITAATPRELVSAVIAAIDNKLTAVRPIDLNLQPGEWYDSPAYAARLAEAISDARAGYRPIMKKWLQENALILERKIPGNKRVMPAATLTVGTATPRQVAEAAIAAISENLITVHPTALIPEKGEAYDSLAYRSRLAHAIQEAHAGHNPTMKRWLEANATVLQQNLIGGTGQAPPDLSAASPRQVAEAAIAAMNKNLIGQPVGSREERDFESAKAASDHLNMLATIAHYAKSAGAITAPNELGPGKHPWRPPVNMEPGERYNSPEYAEHLAEAIQDARAGRFPVMQKWLSDHAPILERNIPGDKLLAQASPQEIVAAAVAAMENHERGLRVDSEGYVIDPAYDKRIGRIPLPIERGEKTQVEAAKTAWKKIIEDLAFRWHGIDPRSAAQLRSLGFPLPDIIRPFSPREVGTTISRRDLEELRKVLRQITPDNFDG
jgi:hypothetical protein